ncbi:MAG TPA: helix-turn-helix domain-containing protein [Solirubrobacterales bacterium]|jgi:AcrR family transcriptional regulator
MSTSEVDIRPLRADALRNRARVLDAARELMGARGVDVGMEEIARAAGVGVGTVYRHFPNKEALISALAEDRFERIAALLREALDDPDPWHGFETMMRRGAELQVADRALTEVMRNHGNAMEAAATKYEVPELTERLVKRCKAAGVLRDDVHHGDIPMVLCGVGTATCSAAGRLAGEDGWKRYLEYVLEGMRAE